MRVANDKYDKLAPRASYLRDVVVLSQAWKKTHTYIRRYNWYADTLELDCSAFDLEAQIADWSAALADGTYRPSPAWLVPAPKSGLWSFSAKHPGGWAPRLQDHEEPPVLRPLAHIGIREQTVSTAAMLCLADCIESAQGDPATLPSEAASKKVYSYGNRLFCSWLKGKHARFSWGNTNTYSRYSQDYQRFVERPSVSALLSESEKRAGQHVYIVKLDISAFFDNIDIDRLVNGMREEYEKFSKDNPGYRASNQTFWRITRRALQFEWREEDRKLANLFRDGKLPRGLPQGLVSSGFFANAYLLDFDRSIGRSIGRRVHQTYEIKIDDYCRYVDDLRLVVTVTNDADEEINEEILAQEISHWVQRRLKLHTTSPNDRNSYLRINDKKTELERLGEVVGESRTAIRMKSLQQQLSGPFDIDTLRQAEAGLSGLLSLAELGLLDEASSLTLNQSLGLASVAKTKLEVRDDTLTRFSAFRITRSLRMRRSMTDLSKPTEEDALLHDFEAAARRLVAAWAVNPSLVQVLRYALDIFPSSELLEPISQALTTKLQAGGSGTQYEERVIHYVLAELFKAGATETGLRSEKDIDFPVANVAEYRIALAQLAQAVMEIQDIPWYVQQQASLLLAATGQVTSSISDGPELRLHRSLHAFLAGKSNDLDSQPINEVIVSLVGHQLLSDNARYVKWFRKFSSRHDRITVSRALTLIGETTPQLFSKIVRRRRGVVNVQADLAPKYLENYNRARWSNGWRELPTEKWIPLATAITHPGNFFSQENSLLKLALSLSENSTIRKTSAEFLTPLNVEIFCTDWGALNDPRRDVFQLRLAKMARAHDPVYATPSWCGNRDAKMYAIGRLLRAAATGEPDFTVRHWLFREDPGWYQGFRSTWQKRRMGMLHTSDALGGTTAAITPWFSEVLLGLLRWPGLTKREGDLPNSMSSPRELSKLLKARIDFQRLIYGDSADLPFYRYPINWSFANKQGLRVALVQGLMPLQRDFSEGLGGLHSIGYRERHRNHTAALLHLADGILSARDYVLGSTKKPHVDLVIFPELTIHVDDQDLMRAFSDATGAMLFYGLLGAKAPGTEYAINAGRWLVPQRTAGRRSWVEVDQGKWHLTKDEEALGIKPWRPYQVIIELCPPEGGAPFRISGSICYDATDLSLVADLRDESHMYVVSAMNKDVKTFDGMVAALKYHMYQHVVIANTGEFGGSTAQAPYDQEHRRLIAHSHGAEQISVAVFDVKTEDFGPQLEAAKEGIAVVKPCIQRIGKTPPAGLRRS